MTLGKIRNALKDSKQVFYYGDTGCDLIDESDEMYSVSVIDASGSSILCSACIKDDDLSETEIIISHEDFEFDFIDVI
jgi:hypothetical protein